MNSLDFVKSRIQFGHCNKMNIDDYRLSFEYDFNNFIKTCSTNIQNIYKNNMFNILMKSDDGEMNIIINYDPDAEFEYFTLESCVCDGTSVFMLNLMEKILFKLFQYQTYNNSTVPKDLKKNIWSYNLKYSVGNFVLNNEYGDFGTEEKPWMNSRFTAMLPIKCEWYKK